MKGMVFWESWQVIDCCCPGAGTELLMLNILKTLWQGVPQLNKALHEE